MDKLKDVPPVVINKFFREVDKAKKKMFLNIHHQSDGKTKEEISYIAELQKDILLKRYKQLIGIHLKKYGINSL